MDKSELVKFDDIQSRIYTIRGVQVMLDRDLAEFYSVKPIKLREQIKRNIRRFPPDFMFQLSQNEAELMVSQNAIPSKQHLGGFLPYVFSEQGVAAVSSILSSERAIDISIQIMRAFVSMRRFISNNAQIFQRLDTVEIKQIETDSKIEKVLTALENKQLQPKQGIFFEGQIFDAHNFVSDLVRSAEKSIVLIDNFVDDSVLTLFSKRKYGVNLKILTKNVTKQLRLDMKKFNEQFPVAEIQEFDLSHDRFLIIDNKSVYHIGASLKDLGKKWFAFSKMDIEIDYILKRIGN
ncbi:MAG TPA: ORF6N domain-containing protein [bacterium]|nr:ORF6N domain-containing protein [bacterium]